MLKQCLITAFYIFMLVPNFLDVHTAGADDAGVSIAIRRQTQDDWLAVGDRISLTPLNFDEKAQKKLGAILTVPDLKSLIDENLRGRLLTSVLPLDKVKAIYVRYCPHQKQAITRTMTDRDLISLLQNAKFLAASDMNGWQFGPGGGLTLTTVNDVEIHVGLLLGGRGTIQIAGKSIYFEYNLASKNKGDTTPAK
jgi:hypothetical protein